MKRLNDLKKCAFCDQKEDGGKELRKRGFKDEV